MGDSNSDKKIAEEVYGVIELAKELQDSASSFISRFSHEDQSLRQRASALDSSIVKLRSSIHSDVKRGVLDRKIAEKLEEELFRARCTLRDGDAASFLPVKPHGGFLKMFLGPISVRATRKDVQLKIKEEYNSYKDRTAILFLLFPSVLLLLRSWVWEGCLPTLPVQMYQAWLLFLYTSLALRENVLRANGSDIRSWWIFHHYCAMLMALVSLTWEIKGQPDCAHKQRGVHLFLQWAIMQGVAMLLQNRYQRQRLYTRIALGKAKRMDVVWGETAGVEGQLWLLCPILFVLQIFIGVLRSVAVDGDRLITYHAVLTASTQNDLAIPAALNIALVLSNKGFEAYVGLLLLKIALVGLTSEWQVMVSGMLLVLMAVGNFANTVQTLMSKSRVKAKIKKSKSKPELAGSSATQDSRSS